MNENENYLKNYDYVSNDVKYISNSIIRLKILESLFIKPQNMKDLADATQLTYSSISTNLHGLELKDFVSRESNKYYLSNSLKLQMRQVLELKDIINFLYWTFNIIEGHVVNMIPSQSISEMHLLCNAELIESGGIDAYKINAFIENALSDAAYARCVFPFYHLNFNKKLNNLIKEDKFVEIMVSQEIFEIYEKKSLVKYLSSFQGEKNFLLIVTDKIMILGLFKEDGQFDQNRLLTSNDYDAIKWANNLFSNFKRNNK